MPAQPVTLSLELLDRVIAGETTESDKAALAHFAREHPRSARFIELLRTQYMRSSGDPARLDRMLNDVLHAIAAPVPREKSARPVLQAARVWGPQSLRRGLWSTAAGAVLGAAVMVAGWYVGTLPIRERGRANVATTVRTTRGERATVMLPDGSTVMLAPASRVQYDLDFSTRRVVDLDGEGYFTIPHREGAPFIVRTVGTVTRVLGTTFSVRKYTSDTAVRVLVVSGRVTVAGGGVLSAGDAEEIVPHGAMVITHGVDMTHALGWLEGRLAFVNTPLREIVPELERMYDVKIVIQDPAVAELPLTMTVTEGRLDAVLQGMEASLGVRVTHVGKSVLFASRSHS